MTGNPIRQFSDALAERGILPPSEIVGDGSFQRADVEASGGKGDASYILHLDEIPAGSICNWRDGLGWQSWKANIGRTLTSAERDALKAKAEQQRQTREEAEAKRRADFKAKSLALWTAAHEATPEHPYLKRKQVTPKKLKVYHGDLCVADMPCEGALMVPLMDELRELSALQFINPEGDKRYFGPTAGRFFPISKPSNDGTLLICEGVATGLSLAAATGYPVAVALDAGNLARVGKLHRDRHGAGLTLIFCADDDAGTEGNPGLTKATEAAAAVGALVAAPDFGADRPEGMTDFNDLAELRGPEAVQRCIENAGAPKLPESQPIAQSATGALVASPPPPPAEDWPESLADASMQGLAGDIVRAIAPHTESDPAAILIQTLVAFGALVGRGPHVPIEGDQHHANLFAVITGKSSKARKGTSWGRVKALFGPVVGWPRVVEGLSSGEGLKYNVRDSVRKVEKDAKTGYANEVETDPGIADQRILVVESEFSQVLRQCARPGNTLSATVRSAWDSGNLQTLTKNDPVTATGAHVCIIGHITAEELRAELTATDSANGFANRFMFMAAERSKLLPFGGERLDPDLMAELSSRIASAAGLARTRGAMHFTPAAREGWEDAYAVLSEGQSGLLGAVTARAEAQTLRLALVFALMDGAAEIDLCHLDAALAIWERCEASARFIFGSAIGDRVADVILRSLRAAPDKRMTRTQISGLFSKNETAERIGAALALLETRGLARRHKAAEDARGRPSETWAAV